MLLCIDIGNTNIVAALAKNKKIVVTHRFETKRTYNVLELGEILRNVAFGEVCEEVDDIIISSVVPSLDAVMVEVCM